MTDKRTELELRIVTGDAQAELQTRLTRSLTTLGSEPAAQVRLAGLPDRWAVVQLEGDAVRLRLLGGDRSHLLRAGEELTVDGVTLGLRRTAAGSAEGLPVQPLVDRLSDVECPIEALGMMLDGILDATAADGGAVILREQGDYTVAVARQGQGIDLPGAKELLSDHIVREVLAAGSSVWVPDASLQERYASIPSVVSLRLRSAVCVPMQLRGTVLGAIFLGKRDLGQPFTRRQVEDLSLLASLSVPWLIQLRRVPPAAGPAEEIVIGECGAIQAVQKLIRRVAPTDLSVLILGETGTGKELVARALHAASRRSGLPMVVINCSAVPESLLEAELFGCKKGAFTGAVADRKGRVEQAHKSTLFLDEIGDMPLPMQATLLRVLEERAVTRLGENQARPVDFRLITATHKNLAEEVERSRFRKDLLYRVNEFTIELPPLSVRGSDILLLAQLFLRQLERQLGLAPRRIGASAAERIMTHAWPGNVRELRACIRRAAILCDRGQIRPEHLRIPEPGPDRPAEADERQSDLGDLTPLSRARDDFVTRYVSAAIQRHRGDREAAAAALGISVRSLYRYLKNR